ncbi:hypothetical protein P3T76_000040 [Phytophthora citrophthora]|uniref:Tetraspanin/Peripherin n=1 Tax=Phytophthora citrophthora TaxID=4793 RepID=A0AAD9LS09_9STRA|nr:hypothetical protein P3T76_000040 [Phytophthora citrophthora]
MARLTVAGGLMVLVNIGFLVAGALLLRFKSTLESSGWADALVGTDYESAADTATTAVQILGIAAITLALIGIVGAIIQNRLLLLLYSVIMVIAMSAFGVLAGTAFTFKTKMTDWEESTFPAEDQESKLAETFNEVYCYAEGYYYCNNATAQEAYGTFFPNASTTLVSLLPNTTGIVSLCNELNGTVEGLATVCEACNMSTTFAKYDKILTWAESKCPRTATTGQWCASFLATGTAGAVFDGAPYGQCRTIFLDVAIDWSGTMGIAGLLVAIAAAVIVALACFARRSKSSRDERLTKV